MAWRQLWRKRTALVGMGIIVVLVLTAILADILVPYEPTATGSGVPMSLPNWQHPLGTDMLGRDMGTPRHNEGFLRRSRCSRSPRWSGFASWPV
jgi:ABC-type dipeptide/oligopeptide/nickel transport system permease subunit